jgi:hypothetical protein
LEIRISNKSSVGASPEHKRWFVAILWQEIAITTNVAISTVVK